MRRLNGTHRHIFTRLFSGLLIVAGYSIHFNLAAETIIAETKAAAPDDTIEVITVTAQKHEEEIQQVPISITALSGDELESLGISEPQDIADFTPGVYSRPTVAHSNPLFSVRGIGFNDFTSIQNPAVAVYVNQVIVPYHTMMGFQLFDMERVEVMKGPQGTLYGRNSTAGAINFITKKPTFEAEAYGIVDYSSYDTTQIEVMVNGPVSDQLAARFAIRSLRRTGSYQTNRLDEDGNYGKQDQLDGRLTLLWEPNDDMDLTVSLRSGYDRSGLVAPEHLATFDATTFAEPCTPVAGGDRSEGACTNAQGYFDADGDPYEGDYSVLDDRLRNSSKGASIELNWYLADFTFTSITGYDSFTRYQPKDADASPYANIDMLYQDESTAFSQELRLSSENNDRYHWMAGLYYSEDDVDANQSADVSDLPGLSTATATNDQQSDSSAIFANLDYWLNKQWKLFGGLRFTDEHKKWEGGSTLDSNRNLSSNNIDTQDLSGNIGIQHQLNDNNMLYASFTKSYRSGAFPGGFTMTPDFLEPVEQEDVYAYETGIKSMLLKKHLMLNASLYYYDWREFQTTKSELSGGLVSLHLINAGDADIYGAELDMSWQPNDHWELGVGVNWMSTEITKSSRPELEGNELSNAPELMLNGLVRYHFDFRQLPITLQSDIHYTDEYFFATDNEPVFYAPSLWLLNARVSIDFPPMNDGKSIQAALWGKNLTDEEYRVGGFSQMGFSGDSFFYYGEPQTVGISLKVNY